MTYFMSVPNAVSYFAGLFLLLPAPVRTFVWLSLSFYGVGSIIKFGVDRV